MENMSSSQEHQKLCPKQTKTSTDALRAKIREISLKDRADVRAAVYDGVRLGLGEIKSKLQDLEDLTEKDVHGLTTRIKRRKHATVEDMYRLSHAFLQSNENLNTFANTPGALQVLVKELTGTNAERQVCAVECLCNLSLGEAHVCEKISNAAGSYLITYIDSSEERLKRNSLWTLANILATSSKATQTLLQMELIRKLWTNYVSVTEDYSEDAAICLTLISARGKQALKEHEWQFLLENFCAKNSTSVGSEYHLQLVFKFGFVNMDFKLDETQIQYLVNCALNNLHSSAELKSEKERLRIVYAIRVLANLLATHNEAYDILLKQLDTVWHLDLIALFNKIFAFSEKTLIVETLWLLKNVIQLQSQQQSTAHDVENFLQKINLPREVVGYD